MVPFKHLMRKSALPLNDTSSEQKKLLLICSHPHPHIYSMLSNHRSRTLRQPQRQYPSADGRLTPPQRETPQLPGWDWDTASAMLKNPLKLSIKCHCFHTTVHWAPLEAASTRFLFDWWTYLIRLWGLVHACFLQWPCAPAGNPLQCQLPGTTFSIKHLTATHVTCPTWQHPLSMYPSLHILLCSDIHPIRRFHSTNLLSIVIM